jgi:DNA-directed RNA polymerase specialized sigma24 family protein
VAEVAKSELEKTLTALLLISLGSLSQKQQIAILDKAGFGQSEVAGIVGSTPKAVSVRLAELRRAVRKGRNQRSK